MTINVTARNVTVRESFHQALEKKLSKLDRFFDQDVVANVTISSQANRETVEITIRANSMVFRSEKTTADRLDSLEAVVDSLFRQIVKNKSKLEKRLKNSAFVQTEDWDYVGTQEEYGILRTKRFSMKPMDVEEAILQMNLLGHTFFMFRNAEDEEIAVVYKRDDGNYGLIEANTDDE